MTVSFVHYRGHKDESLLATRSLEVPPRVGEKVSLGDMTLFVIDVRWDLLTGVVCVTLHKHP